ncbi:MAG: TetR/AcrR family transcriptional regulator [Lachnospiraceae bacterium]|nr:TetR/AcrR family transcriptional regulator [Lachnospiraceae bacterium]
MPRKETITRDKLLGSAFELIKEQGIGELSARHLATKAGCSTQPIFRLYKNMEDLEKDVFETCVAYFSQYCNEFGNVYDTPFVNLGMAYISFARDNKNLFRVLFVDENQAGKSMYDLVNGGNSNLVIKEIKKIENVDPAEAGEIFSKMWVFIHGIACMVIRNDFDLSREETAEMLIDMFRRIHGSN